MAIALTLLLTAAAYSGISASGQEYYAIYEVELESGDGTRILGTIEVTFTPTPYGVSTDYDVIEVIDYSGSFEYLSPEETLDTVVSFDTMVFNFYSDPGTAGSPITHSEFVVDGNSTLVIDLSYDEETGVLESAYIRSVDAYGGVTGYSKYTLKSTNAAPATLSSGGEEASTEGTGTRVGEGDWAAYRVTFYISRYDGDYIRGSLTFRVVYHQGAYGVEYEITDIQIESVDSSRPDQLNESTATSFVQSIDYYTPMWEDPAELPSDGVVEGSETYVTYRGEYFTDTGVLKSSSISLSTSEGEGQIDVQIIQSSVATPEPGDTPQAGEVLGTDSDEAQATPAVREGDWAVYRVTFDITDAEGNYMKGSVTYKVVFHDYGYGIDYELAGVNIESFDSNTGGSSESAINEVIAMAEYMAPVHVDPAYLPPNGVIEQTTDYYTYRAEYDPNLGILRSMTVSSSGQGSGRLTVDLIDTSIAGLAPVAGGGLGGMTTLIVIAAAAAAAAIAAVIFLRKRSRKPQYTYGQPEYGPPPPPSPPPPPQ